MPDEILDPFPYPGKRPIAWVTWTLLGSTVAVFLLQLLELHLNGDDIVGNTLAFSSEAWADHRYWTLVTYAWAHAVAMVGVPNFFWMHIGTNMICLFVLGPALEEYLGHWSYLFLYLGGAIAAALFWFIFCSKADPGQDIIGCSGATFALMAGCGVATSHLVLRIMALIICGAEIAQGIFGWLPEIAHTVHIGGAIFGFLYVLVVRLIARRARVYG